MPNAQRRWCRFHPPRWISLSSLMRLRPKMARLRQGSPKCQVQKSGWLRSPAPVDMKVTWGIFFKHWDYNEITGYELYKFTIYQLVEDFATIHSRIVPGQKAVKYQPWNKHQPFLAGRKALQTWMNCVCTYRSVQTTGTSKLTSNWNLFNPE